MTESIELDEAAVRKDAENWRAHHVMSRINIGGMDAAVVILTLLDALDKTRAEVKKRRGQLAEFVDAHTVWVERNEAATARADAAESALAAVRELHPMLVGCDCDRGCGCPPGGPPPRCIKCRTTWPCRTIAAIEAALATPTTPEETR